VTVAHVVSNGTSHSVTPEVAGTLVSDGYERLYGAESDVFERPYEPLLHEDRVASLDSITVRERFDQLGLDGLARDILDSALTVNFNGPLERGAYTQGLRRFALALARPALLPEVVRFRLVGGFQALVAAIADDAKAEVRLSSPVAAISSVDDGVLVDLRDGGRVSASQAIVTIPIELLRDVRFDPPLQGAKARLAAEGQVTQGVMLWIHLAGDHEPFMCFAPGSSSLVFMKYDGQVDGGGVVAQAFGPDGRQLHPDDREAVETAVRQWLPEAHVTETLGHDWVGDEWSREAWAMYRPGHLTHLRELQAPHGRVHLAGAGVASGWVGYFDGAIESGITAARRCLAAA
jgi:protoporphyrinogen oxidase